MDNWGINTEGSIAVLLRYTLCWDEQKQVNAIFIIYVGKSYCPSMILKEFMAKNNEAIKKRE